MSKKHKKKKNHYISDSIRYDFSSIRTKSKKALSNDIDATIKDIETMRFRIMEADKCKHHKERKRINACEREFYTSMEGIKCRRKMAKEWERSGFLDRIIEMLKEVAPIIKALARAVMTLISTFLSLTVVKQYVSIGVIDKLTRIFNMASMIA